MQVAQVKELALCELSLSVAVFIFTPITTVVVRHDVFPIFAEGKFIGLL